MHQLDCAKCHRGGQPDGVAVHVISGDRAGVDREKVTNIGGVYSGTRITTHYTNFKEETVWFCSECIEAAKRRKRRLGILTLGLHTYLRWISGSWELKDLPAPEGPVCRLFEGEVMAAIRERHQKEKVIWSPRCFERLKSGQAPQRR